MTRTTIVLDEDVLKRLQAESRLREASFKTTLNEVIRDGLAVAEKRRSSSTTFKVKPREIGLRSGLSYDSVSSLIEFGEGEGHSVTLLDANILLYAFDSRATGHVRIRKWLEALLSAWAFIRISTNPRLNEKPLRPEEAIAIVGELTAHPFVVMVNPGRRHQEILLSQMRNAQVRGRETTDAVIASFSDRTRSDTRIY